MEAKHQSELCPALLGTIDEGVRAGDYAEVGRAMRALSKLGATYGIACVITNQVVAKPDAMSFGPQMAPIGGNIIAHASHTRLQLKKARGENRVCKVIDSPSIAESEASFSVGPAGVEDAKE